MLKKKHFLLLLAFSFSGMQACSSRETEKKNPKITDAGEILADLKAGKNIFIENKTVSGDLDFTGLDNTVREGKMVTRCYIAPAITFINCVFTGKISTYKNIDENITLCDFAKSITFSECQFKEEVTMRESIIHGNASFLKSFFIKKSTFEGSRFMGECIFSGANFAEELRAQNIQVDNKCNFMDAIFGKAAYFQSGIFTGDLQMSTTKWEGYADLSVCTFRAGCFFNYAVFNDRSVFSNSHFAGRAEFFKTTFTGNSEFRNCYYAGPVKMQQATVSSTLNWQGSVFLVSFPDTGSFVQSSNSKLLMEQVKTGIIK